MWSITQQGRFVTTISRWPKDLFRESRVYDLVWQEHFWSDPYGFCIHQSAHLYNKTHCHQWSSNVARFTDQRWNWAEFSGSIVTQIRYFMPEPDVCMRARCKYNKDRKIQWVKTLLELRSRWEAYHIVQLFRMLCDQLSLPGLEKTITLRNAPTTRKMRISYCYWTLEPIYARIFWLLRTQTRPDPNPKTRPNFHLWYHSGFTAYSRRTYRHRHINIHFLCNSQDGTTIILWAFGSIDKDREWNYQDYHQENRGSLIVSKTHRSNHNEIINNLIWSYLKAPSRSCC